jgi:hypothetical protein
VSLLQTASSAINSVPELMDSRFKLSMRNVTYGITYVNVSVLVNHLRYHETLGVPSLSEQSVFVDSYKQQLILKWDCTVNVEEFCRDFFSSQYPITADNFR